MVLLVVPDFILNIFACSLPNPSNSATSSVILLFFPTPDFAKCFFILSSAEIRVKPSFLSLSFEPALNGVLTPIVKILSPKSLILVVQSNDKSLLTDQLKLVTVPNMPS